MLVTLQFTLFPKISIGVLRIPDPDKSVYSARYQLKCPDNTFMLPEAESGLRNEG